MLIALVTWRGLPELAPDDRLLRDALVRRGADVHAVVWDDPSVDWRSYDAIVVRSTWDYHKRFDEFHAWLGTMDGLPMWNPPSVLRSNTHKSYLLDLQSRGVEIVPTLLVPRGQRFIVKPAVSATAFRTEHHDTDTDVLIQPLVPEVLTRTVSSHSSSSASSSVTPYANAPQAATFGSGRAVAVSRCRVRGAFRRCDSLAGVNAYVLVGGRSRRMGESKVEMFLDRVVSAAREAFDDVIAVGRAEAAPLVRTIFEHPHEREGAIFGVVRALQDARGKCFLLAVDYPLITSDVLRFLRDREGIPEWNGSLQPLCAVWDSAWLPRIEERIARGELDLRGAAETDMIPESELRSRFSGEPLLNVNTPEEWERAQRLLASR